MGNIDYIIMNLMKVTKKNPILNIINNFLIDSPLPLNISYFWNFGSLLGLN